MDAAKGFVTVSGSVEPDLLIDKLEVWGKKAELWSFRKFPLDSDHVDENATNPCPNAQPNRPLHDNPKTDIKGGKKKKRGIWYRLGKKIFGLKPQADESPTANKVAHDGHGTAWHYPRAPIGHHWPLYVGPFYGPWICGTAPMLNPYGYNKIQSSSRSVAAQGVDSMVPNSSNTSK